MRIFVQIASYRDPQLIPTIEDMLKKSAHPEHLRIGICRQYHPSDGFDDLRRYRKDTRFRILEVPHLQSKGVGWARSLVQRMFQGEEYTLQIDSHMRFRKQWDESLLEMIRTLQSMKFSKPLLTGYVPAFEPGLPFKCDSSEPPLRMVIDCFSPDGVPLFKADPIPDWQHLTSPSRARFLSGGFCFTLGKFCSEVQYDPDLYFYGEEISMTVRAFTHGYDLFHPHKTVLWHYYERDGESRHWDDHKDWRVQDDLSVNKTRELLGMEVQRTYGKAFQYGLGTVRTLKDYEEYAGIALAKSASQR